MFSTAVLFAGGLSRRMGVDKATPQIPGEPLWARQLRVLRELQPATLWVSARARSVWCPPDIGVVTDVSPSRGPLSGLVAALRRLHSSHLLVLAVDLPQMTAGHLWKLRALAHVDGGVIPLNGDHFEPLCAIYPIKAAAVANDMLADGRMSLQHLAEMLLQHNLAQAYLLNEAEIPLYHNVNMPGDLLK
jgi:molybdopterin-guanine dinucleotide biosynthesis protein A